jgi:uncharacterized protein (DUF58 family)
MSPNQPSYLDPFVLARIGNLSLRTKYVAEGILSGKHPTPAHGRSLEFAEHRPYVLGDELKNIDWKVYGRLERLWVKEFEQETPLRLQLFLDGSGSMRFKGEHSPFSKYDYGATLAASLGYLTLRQGDLVGLSYTQEDSDRIIPPRNTPSHLNIILQALECLHPQGARKLSESLETLAHSCKKRSVIAIFSDLLGDFDAILRALKFLKFKKHEVMVFHLLDREEKELPYSGTIRFESFENQTPVVTDVASFRGVYQQTMANWMERYRRALRNAAIDYDVHTTDAPLDRVLRRVLTH